MNRAILTGDQHSNSAPPEQTYSSAAKSVVPGQVDGKKVLLLFAETTHTEPCEDLQNTKNFPQENVQKHNYMTSRDMHRPAEKGFVRW